MKKLLVVFAVLAASSMAQAESIGTPFARTGGAPSIQVAEHGPNAYRRAEHKRMRHHRKHHRHHR